MKNQTNATVSPQRTSGASGAVITRTRTAHTAWLLQWNPQWQAMNLIGGRKETTDANDLTCLIREIHEELFEDLPPEELTRLQTALQGNNNHYNRSDSQWQDACIDAINRIGSGPFECEGFSEGAKCLTQYTFHIYHVTLHAHARLVQHDAMPIEWGTAADIRRGVTVQGRPIGKTVAQIMEWCHRSVEHDNEFGNGTNCL